VIPTNDFIGIIELVKNSDTISAIHADAKDFGGFGKEAINTYLL